METKEEKENMLLIFMDDSGKLNTNEVSTIYGGIYFTKMTDYINFKNKYSKLIKEYKKRIYKRYFNENKNKKFLLSFDDFELKGTTLRYMNNIEKRRIFNLISSQKIFAVFIDNSKVYESIMETKQSRGRYSDYSQKIIIKRIVEHCIKKNELNPTSDAFLNIKIDEETKPTNGYYDLESSIFEELKNGIRNYNYNKIHKPIFKSDLKVKVRQYKSKNNIGIQASDFVAYLLKKEYDQKKQNKYIDKLEVKKFLP